LPSLRYLIEGGVPIGYSIVQIGDLRAEAQFWRLPPVDATVEFKFGGPVRFGSYGWRSKRAATGGDTTFGLPKPSFVGLPKPSFVVPTSPSAAPSTKNGSFSADTGRGAAAEPPKPKSGIFSGLKLTAPAAGVRIFGSTTAAKFSTPPAQPAGSPSGPASAGTVSYPEGDEDSENDGRSEAGDGDGGSDDAPALQEPPPPERPAPPPAAAAVPAGRKIVTARRKNKA
jgi:hypothetical protein